jgi:hypothetical protein
MHMYKPLALLSGVLLAAGVAGAGADQPAAKAEAGTLIVLDSAGKDQKLKTWKFAQGVRHLEWLAPATEDREPAPKDKKDGKPPRGKPKAAGPEALEFREENSTNFVNGILTLIPLDRLRSLDYDAEKDTVTAKVAADKEDVTLTGTTKYRGINKIAIEAEVDKGDLGVAEIKYLGGVPRGIKGLHFPSPKIVDAPTGRAASVTILDKDKKTPMPVTDLQALYRTANGEKLLPLLMFKKTLKLDVSKIKKIVAAEGGDGEDKVWQVTLKDGNDEALTLLQVVQHEGKEMALEGLLGKVPAGYKLFPIHVIGEVEFEPAKEPAKEPGVEK